MAARAVAAQVAFWGRGGRAMALTDRLVLLYALYSGSLANLRDGGGGGGDGRGDGGRDDSQERGLKARRGGARDRAGTTIDRPLATHTAVRYG
jgi:hypothetical protein